jgi:hypothetical protein
MTQLSNSNSNNIVVMERAARAIQVWWISQCEERDEQYESRWDGCRYERDGCRYECVQCKRVYKNKYFGRDTRFCHDCEWDEHNQRKRA